MQKNREVKRVGRFQVESSTTYYQEVDVLEQYNYYRIVEKILKILDIVQFTELRAEVKLHTPVGAVERQCKLNDSIEWNKECNDSDINEII